MVKTFLIALTFAALGFYVGHNIGHFTPEERQQAEEKAFLLGEQTAATMYGIPVCDLYNNVKASQPRAYVELGPRYMHYLVDSCEAEITIGEDCIVEPGGDAKVCFGGK
jgi:hypothetical protein